MGKPSQKNPKQLSIQFDLTLIHAHSPRSGLSAGKLCGDQKKAGFLRLLSNGNCNCSCCCSLWPNFCLPQTPRATLLAGNLHSHRLISSSKSLLHYFILLLQVGLFSDITLVPASAVCFLLPWKQWNHSHCLCPALIKAWEQRQTLLQREESTWTKTIDLQSHLMECNFANTLDCTGKEFQVTFPITVASTACLTST